MHAMRYSFPSLVVLVLSVFLCPSNLPRVHMGVKNVLT